MKFAKVNRSNCKRSTGSLLSEKSGLTTAPGRKSPRNLTRSMMKNLRTYALLMPSTTDSNLNLLSTMEECYSKLATLVPTVPEEDKTKIKKVDLLQHVIDYIADLQTALNISCPGQISGLWDELTGGGSGGDSEGRSSSDEEWNCRCTVDSNCEHCQSETLDCGRISSALEFTTNIPQTSNI